MATITRILVPVDFSDASLRALDYAVEFGRRRMAQLIVLHAVEPVYYPALEATYGIGFDLGNVYDQIEQAARTRLARLAGELRARRVKVRTLLAQGTAHQVIVDSAAKLKADLIVMSTHGRSGLSHALLGSVAERVLRTAKCPVVTVRGRRPRAGSPPAKRPGRRRPPRAGARRRSVSDRRG
jgi:nucleotide-binding universal stress UspA family protein